MRKSNGLVWMYIMILCLVTCNHCQKIDRLEREVNYLKYK